VTLASLAVVSANCALTAASPAKLLLPLPLLLLLLLLT